MHGCTVSRAMPVQRIGAPCCVTAALAFLLIANPCQAADPYDPCSAAQTTSDVRLVLSLKNGRSVFEEGEIVPLVLSFTSTTKNRYSADVRNYDRSGRLGTENYCIEPEAPDPLESYFQRGGFMLGGLGSTRVLDSTPFIAEAELNEWHSLPSGHYRVYAVSHRVSHWADAGERTPYGLIPEVIRSNAVEFDVRPVDAAWQAEQLREALQAIAKPASPEDARHAERVLRFLNTRKSTRALARLFSDARQQQSNGWELMLGLYGSPYPQVAIDAMRDEFGAPDHAISSLFLDTLVRLQVSADPDWAPPTFDAASADSAASFWQTREAHTRAVMKAEMEKVIAALPRKSGKARALTLNGLLATGAADESTAELIRPALIAAWADLPRQTQEDLIDFRWQLIASPEMVPVLRKMVAEPPPSESSTRALIRNKALMHLYELDPAAARECMLRDALNPNAYPSLEVVALLPEEDRRTVVQGAVERIQRHDARNVDYELIERYAGASVLGVMQGVFETYMPKWACMPQTALLRYFLRVDPAYGSGQVEASLRARQDTHCYTTLLQKMGDQLPKVQQCAIEALDDSDLELAQDAARTLGKWGTAEAEEALWKRLQRFRDEWAGRELQLRAGPDFDSPGSHALLLQQALVYAIARGTNWLCPPDKLARLRSLVLTEPQRQEIDRWVEDWNRKPAMIVPSWSSEKKPDFSVFQYDMLTEEQLRAKLGQFPKGTRLLWLFWEPGHVFPPVSMATQEAVYERMRAVAEKNAITLGRR